MERQCVRRVHRLRRRTVPGVFVQLQQRHSVLPLHTMRTRPIHERHMRGDEQHGVRRVHHLHGVGVPEQGMQCHAGRGVPAVHPGVPRRSVPELRVQRDDRRRVLPVQIERVSVGTVPIATVQPGAEPGVLVVWGVWEPVLQRAAVRAPRRRGGPGVHPRPRDRDAGAGVQLDVGHRVRVQGGGLHRPQRRGRMPLVPDRAVLQLRRLQRVHRLRERDICPDQRVESMRPLRFREVRSDQRVEPVRPLRFREVRSDQRVEPMQPLRSWNSRLRQRIKHMQHVQPRDVLEPNRGHRLRGLLPRSLRGRQRVERMRGLQPRLLRRPLRVLLVHGLRGRGVRAGQRIHRVHRVRERDGDPQRRIQRMLHLRERDGRPRQRVEGLRVVCARHLRKPDGCHRVCSVPPWGCDKPDRVHFMLDVRRGGLRQGGRGAPMRRVWGGHVLPEQRIQFVQFVRTGHVHEPKRVRRLLPVPLRNERLGQPVDPMRRVRRWDLHQDDRGIPMRRVWCGQLLREQWIQLVHAMCSRHVHEPERVRRLLPVPRRPVRRQQRVERLHPVHPRDIFRWKRVRHVHQLHPRDVRRPERHDCMLRMHDRTVRRRVRVECMRPVQSRGFFWRERVQLMHQLCSRHVRRPERIGRVLEVPQRHHHGLHGGSSVHTMPPWKRGIPVMGNFTILLPVLVRILLTSGHPGLLVHTVPCGHIRRHRRIHCMHRLPARHMGVLLRGGQFLLRVRPRVCSPVPPLGIMRRVRARKLHGCKR